MEHMTIGLVFVEVSLICGHLLRRLFKRLRFINCVVDLRLVIAQSRYQNAVPLERRLLAGNPDGSGWQGRAGWLDDAGRMGKAPRSAPPLC